MAAPCTGPVLALLLFYVAQSGNVVWGATLTFVFALGLGLLFLVLGIFSGLLTSLPKPGRWMEWVKLIFGIGMILVGCYFLYQAGVMLLHPSGPGS